MIRIRKSSDRGRFRSDWLDARFSISFGNYRDPTHDGYFDLLVLNDDRVAPGAGFAMHPHADIEVMSYPMAGTIEHRDSLGHRALMRPCDVQLTRAGTGICHSEMNASSAEPEHHLQWWIRPAAAALPPAYAHMHVAASEKLNRWRVLAAPGGAGGSLSLAQDACVRDAQRAATGQRRCGFRGARACNLVDCAGRVACGGVAVRPAGDVRHEP